MTPGSSDQALVLSGLDGGNPLGFLAAVGTLLILSDRDDGEADVPRLGWRDTPAGWRPVLAGGGERKAVLCDTLHRSLSEASDEILDIEKMRAGNKESNKFPFDAHRFAKALDEWAGGEAERRAADFPGRFRHRALPGSRKRGSFSARASRWSKVATRKARACCNTPSSSAKRSTGAPLERTLFEELGLRGTRDYNLRWDPIENRSLCLALARPEQVGVDPTAHAPCTAPIAWRSRHFGACPACRSGPSRTPRAFGKPITGKRSSGPSGHRA